jgi:hypothetical protein
MESLKYPSQPKRSAFNALAIGLLLFVATPITSLAQLQVSQDFEGGTNSIPYTGTPTIASFTTPNNGSPRGTAAFNGTKSWYVINTSGQPSSESVTFKNIIFASNSTNNFIQFNLAALSTQPNQGLDTDDNVKVEISSDYGATFYTAATVTGSPNRPNGQPGEAVWRLSATSTATGSFNGSDPSSTSNNVSIPTGTGDLNNAGFGIVRINLSNVKNVTVRITLTNTINNEIWAVDDFGVYSTQPVTLPVTLTSFLASRQSQNVYVKWATASEKDNAFFEVQRSTDGKAFMSIGQVTGNGTTAIGASYSFTDKNPLSVVSYYRLRQVDTDGTSSYSSVVAVSGSDKIEAAFYPNPSFSQVTLPVVNGMVKYRIYNATGQNVATGQAAGGSIVDIQHVPMGVYFLELISADKHNVQRFVKQ